MKIMGLIRQKARTTKHLVVRAILPFSSSNFLFVFSFSKIQC